MFLLRNNSKSCKYVVCVLQFGCSNFYTKNAPKLAILSSKIEKFLERGQCPLSRPLRNGEGTPPPHTLPLGTFGTSILAPSVLDLVVRHPKKVGQHWASRACRGRWSHAVGHPVLYRAAG